MKLRFAIIAALALGSQSFAGDTPEPAVAEPVTFPAAMGVNAAASRSTALSVTKGVYYIVESRVDCLTLCSPDKSLTITNLREKYKTGPIIIGGKFAQEPTVETEKEFTAPFIYKIEPGPSPVPQAEILMITKGENPTVERRTVSLKAPQPPPDDEKKIVNPEASPISAPGLHVIIGEETSDRTKLTANQAAIFTSANLHAFLNDHCVTESVGANEATKAWRIYDKDTKLANESDWVKKVMARKRTTPWIGIYNGQSWVELEGDQFPKSVAEVKQLVEKHKGGK